MLWFRSPDWAQTAAVSSGWEAGWIMAPLCVMYYFSLTGFKIWSWLFRMLTVLSQVCVSLCLSCVGFSELFKPINFFPTDFWLLFLYILFIPSSFFWDPNYIYVRPFDLVPQVPNTCSMAHSLSPLCSSDWIISIYIQTHWLFCHLRSAV